MTISSEYPTPSANYVCPDELDALIDQAQMSPEQEAWCIMAVMDYRLACQQVKLAIEYNNRKNKELTDDLPV